MIKILVNDGMHADGKAIMEKAGYHVDTNNIPQAELMTRLQEYDGIIVRSATKVRKELIDACPNLKVICRGGVGMDNIDVDYARSKGIGVYNTPAASSQSVAELIFAHALTLSRSLQDANRNMPTSGDTEFKKLKKNYAKGTQLRGKTFGIIGFGRIGQEAARIAIGMGMNVLPADLMIKEATIDLEVFTGQKLSVNVPVVAFDEVLAKSDYITLHVPSMDKPLIGEAEFAKMKDGVIVLNASRGGTIDEDALLAALESGKAAGAGLDVFVGEPTPRKDILTHPKISLTPHTGASTVEAQRNIGLELAERLMGHFVA
jgi:D-3-phosphoglycerate dehydrogenase